jgi:nitrate/TMAO reductase-like tetraheme cytochrome c subunit
MSSKSGGSRSFEAKVLAAARVVPILLFVFAGAGTSLATDRNSCVDCHSNSDLLVTNKKLYDYFQEWNVSIHKQEEVECSDCHGGNPDATDARAAHGDGVGVSDEASGIYYKNVPQTCGQCHDEILEGFEKSKHFEHVKKQKDELQGPTCVTCHGSINVGILDVTTVEAACARCHDEEHDNHPENPEKAKAILNRFLSIHRFYRYVSIRIDPSEARSFFEDVDARHRQLSITWHTFDLEQIDKETTALLGVLKEKRDELRKKSRQKKDL